MPNALFTLEQGEVPVPFATAEVALHAFINNKCAAQRVGTGKSKHKQEPSHTVWKRTRLLNLARVKHCPSTWVTHVGLNAIWQNADIKHGASRPQREKKNNYISFGPLIPALIESLSDGKKKEEEKWVLLLIWIFHLPHTNNERLSLTLKTSKLEYTEIQTIICFHATATYLTLPLSSW